MTAGHREKLRSIMGVAWSFSRTDPTRAFSDCLRGAWRWCKGMAKTTAAFMKRARKAGGAVKLSADLIKSPIRSSLKGQRYGRRRDYQAAYLTARLGY